MVKWRGDKSLDLLKHNLLKDFVPLSSYGEENI